MLFDNDGSSFSSFRSASRSPRRARLAALLSAAALVGVAAPAAAEPPLAPAVDLQPMTAPAPAPMVRRNSGLMFSGIALVGAGLVATTVGGIMVLTAHPGPPGSEDSGGEQRFLGLMVGAGGLATSFIGIPLWIIGGSSVPEKTTITVGASGASLRGTF